MKQALLCSFCALLASCATTAPRLTLNPASDGWMQVITIGSGDAADAQQPLMKLRHRGTGAEITVDAYDSGGQSVLQTAELVRNKMLRGYVLCEPIKTGRYVDRGHSAGGLQADQVRVASFTTMFVNERGEIRRGKVSVLKVRGAPAETVFVFAGHWLDKDDVQAAMSFDNIVDSALVK